MIIASHVSEALALFSRFDTVRDAVVVQTHCMYPDNALVAVYVRGGPNSGYLVSDEGRAIDELTISNKVIPDVGRFLAPFCQIGGLRSEKGRIISSRVGLDQLVSAVLFVANASAEVVRRGLSTLKSHSQQGLEDNLSGLLTRSVSPRYIKRDRRVQGESTREYSFDAEIMVAGGRRILIDAIHPNPNSINSRYVAHLDVKRRADETIAQRIVFDDQDEWGSADLSFLQSVATIVPFRQCETNIDLLLEHHHGLLG